MLQEFVCLCVFLQFPFSLPEGRHSHCAINTDSGIIITGGLTRNMNPVPIPVVIKYFDSDWCLSPVKFDFLIDSRYVNVGPRFM